jgi:hypothetical protein
MSGRERARRAVIVTWNPGRDNGGDWSPEQWDAMIAEHRGGAIESDRWCVGRHRNNIAPGDCCYLLRQGGFGRGILARGLVQSYPTADTDRAGPRRPANHVDIGWTSSLRLDDRITTDELAQRVPGVHWSQIYQSGHVIKDEIAVNALAAVWRDRYGAVRGASLR